jgi:peptidoglycan/xylan/chitin deacetylase (PgdA/CDA1 family)
MPRRALPTVFLALLATGCGAQAQKSAPSRADAPAATARTAPAPRAPAIAGAGVGARELLAVARLARTGRPVFCGGARGDMVALTFDDGPGPYTHYVLKRLRRNHMRATFFLNTKNLDRFGSLIARETRFGTVGDHTANHLSLVTLGDAEMRREIDGAQREIGARAGFGVMLFRPPYGAHDAAVDAHVRARRMLQVLWDVDSGDSLGAGWAQIRRHVIAALHPGAIVLLHDNRGQTVRALPDILHAIRRRHLRAVTVPELLAGDPPTGAQLRAGRRGCAGPR